MLISRRDALMLAGSTALVGHSACANPARLPIEVIHWWSSGSESAAIHVIRRKLESEGWVWKDSVVDLPDAAKTAAMTRVLGGQPPTVMLWFVGQDLPQMYHDGIIGDVQSAATAQNWDAVLPEVIRSRIKIDGKYIAVPADLARGNWTFANTRLLRKAGIEVPGTWQQVLDGCARLRQAGVIPIAFGGQKWQESSVFVMVLTGVGGASLLQRFIVEHDPTAAHSPEMVESFAVFGRLKPFIDKASPNRSWSDTANLLITNRAALYFAGDWARGEFDRARLRPDIDYVCSDAPGNQGIFMAVVDAFVMPRAHGPGMIAAQDAFARATMSIGVQHDFNLAKGSIPPRTDVPLNGYDPCAKIAARLARGGGQVIPSSSMGMTTDMRLAMYDVVHRFWHTDNADPKAAARDLRIAIERTMN